MSQRWGLKRDPGLPLPSPSFISQTVLPLGAFWRGPCCGNEHPSRLWSLAFKGLSDFPPGFQTPTMPHASPSGVYMLPREPASRFQASLCPHPRFPFSPYLFSFFICILENTWGDFLVYSCIWYIIFVPSKTFSFLPLLLDPSFDIRLLSSYYVLSTVLDNWGNENL